MSRLPISVSTVWATVALAAVLWFFTFAVPLSNFWIKIALAAAILSALSVMLQPSAGKIPMPRSTDWVYGVLSAVVLWLIFWMGKSVSTWIFSFAGDQIGAIYGKGTGVPSAAVFALLLTVTGPAEEIYWRGFLQKQLMARYGELPGWAMATAAYALVHVCSMNFMLVGAAAVAGAFWGLCYWRWGRLWPVVISHSLWSAFIFAVVPIP